MNHLHHTFSENDNKFKFEIEGIDMHADNFTVTLIRGAQSVTYEKSDFIEELVPVPGGEDKYNYYLPFNSDVFGPGLVTCIVRAWKPDNDYNGGYRKLTDQFDMMVIDPLKQPVGQ